MNGSSQLEEADRKPFLLCPLCLRKLGFYLGFEGSELERYREMKRIFELMNYKDSHKNFTREIQLLEVITEKLREYQSQWI